jgi:hypothetical protein
LDAILRKKCLSCGRSFTLSGSGKPQRYCSECARRGIVGVCGLPASKPLKTNGAKSASEVDLGSFVLAQIQAQKSQPANFTTPDGDRVRIWPSGRTDRKGEEVYWRVNLKELKRLGEKCCGFSEPRKATSDIKWIEGSSHIPLTRLKPNPPARDPHVLPDIWPRPWGYKVKVYIEAERELQELGCGWRTLIVELDGSKVHLHHNGRKATMKRAAFKAFVASNKCYRKRHHKRPQLKLVVSNKPADTTKQEAA